MKKTVFLMVSAMALIVCGCSTGSGRGLLNTAHRENALIHTSTHPAREVADERGVCMSISDHSSLSIDVECILEYVQRGSNFDPANEQGNFLNPWVRLNYSF
jgi:hypothetical protein